jgi:tRNA pseudouridine55 synthase
VDKPAGPTSHDVVAAVRRVWRGARVGHAGTLDPFATGLLLLLLGRATRLAEYASALDKTYLATVRLGAVSTTDDPEGVLTDSPGFEPPSAGAIDLALARFVGEVEQVPPAFSAKHVAGERAYRLARRGAAVTLAPRRVRIDRIERLAWEPPLLTFRAVTGPGVYVRSLARDLGEALGTGGYLAALRREAVGGFRVETAAPAGGGEEALAAALLPPESAVAHLPPARVDAEGAASLLRGAAIPRRAAVVENAGASIRAGRADAARGGRAVRILGPDGLLGVGRLSADSLSPARLLDGGA